MTAAVRRSIGLVAVAVTALSSATVRAQIDFLPEEFSAIANDAGVGAASTSCIDIRINRWASARDEEALSRILVADGPEALLDAVRDTAAAGSIQSPGSLSWSLRFAWQQRTADGGRRIVILTDRPIGGWEILLGSPTLEYPFSVIELWLDGSGEGEGTLSVATQIAIDPDDGLVNVEGYDPQGVGLTRVTSRRPT
jgi:hypothetical protein